MRSRPSLGRRFRYLAAVVWAVSDTTTASMQIAAAPGSNPLSSQPHFATGNMGFGHHLAIGLVSVAVIALLSWALVIFSRKYGFSRSARMFRSEGALRVLSVRRVTQRLHVAAIQISDDRIIVIADNGHALEKLGELSVPPSPGVVG